MSELMDKLETLRDFAFEYADCNGRELKRSVLHDQLNEEANAILGEREDKTYTAKELITLLSQFDDDQKIYAVTEKDTNSVSGVHVECMSEYNYYYGTGSFGEEGRLLICLLCY